MLNRSFEYRITNNHTFMVTSFQDRYFTFDLPNQGGTWLLLHPNIIAIYKGGMWTAELIFRCISRNCDDDVESMASSESRCYFWANGDVTLYANLTLAYFCNSGWKISKSSRELMRDAMFTKSLARTYSRRKGEADGFDRSYVRTFLHGHSVHFKSVLTCDLTWQRADERDGPRGCDICRKITSGVFEKYQSPESDVPFVFEKLLSHIILVCSVVVDISFLNVTNSAIVLWVINEWAKEC